MSDKEEVLVQAIRDAEWNDLILSSLNAEDEDFSTGLTQPVHSVYVELLKFGYKLVS